MTRRLPIVTFVLCCVIGSCTRLSAQITGELPPPPDTLIVFTSPRPLLENDGETKAATTAMGLDLLFSGSGWGLGGFYQHILSHDLTAFFHLAISGRRNTDEFENAWFGPVPVVSNKVNRLFMVPMTVGLQYRLFSESLQDSFRPFVSGGIGPTVILATPYIRDGLYYEFFNSFGYATTYVRPGGFIGFGSFFGSIGAGSLIGVQIRYYTIPFGGNGLESVKGSPINDFGGVFLSLTVGSAY